MNKKLRIKKKKEFDYIIKNGKKVKNNFFILYYIQKKELKSRFGIAVGTKIGNSVIRNKLKRQVKEIIRININNFQNTKDYIIIIRKESLNLSFQKMRENLIDLAEKVKNEKK